MINPLVIREYLNKKTLNLNRFKKLPDSTLDRLMETVAPGHEWNVEPYWHQKLCLVLLLRLKKVLLWLDMGTGKTSIVINAIKFLSRNNKVSNALVLVPNVINVYEWEDEFTKHYGKGRMGVVSIVSDTARLTQMVEDGFSDTIVVTTYASMLYVVWEKMSELTTKGTPRKKKVGKKGQVNKEFCTKVAKHFDVLVMDEGTEAKNWQSLTHKMCSILGHEAKYVYSLTGTPYGRDIQDVWGQYFTVDKGETLGRNITFFRQAFLVEDQGYWSTTYKLKRSRTKILQNKIFNRAIRYRASDCLDLPPTKTLVRKFKLPPEVEYYYKGVQNEIKESSTKTQLQSSFLNMRYMSSGYMVVKDVDASKSDKKDRGHIIKMPVNPKLDYVFSIIEQLPENEKVIIFVEYILTAQLLEEAFTEKKLPFISVHGAAKDGAKKARQWSKLKERFMIATTDSIARGPNLQVSRHIIFYELPLSLLTYRQARKRIHRAGQNRKCFYWVLVMRNTVDAGIRRSYRDGINLMRRFVNNRGLTY